MKFARRKHLDVQQVRRNIRRFSIPATPDGYPSLTLRRAKLRDDFSVFSSCDGESGGRWVLKLFETSALHRGERGETLQEKLRRRNNGAVAADRRCRSRTRREGGEVDLAPSTPAGSIPLGTPPRSWQSSPALGSHSRGSQPAGSAPSSGAASTFLGAWRERSRCRWSRLISFQIWRISFFLLLVKSRFYFR